MVTDGQPFRLLVEEGDHFQEFVERLGLCEAIATGLKGAALMLPMHSLQLFLLTMTTRFCGSFYIYIRPMMIYFDIVYIFFPDKQQLINYTLFLLQNFIVDLFIQFHICTCNLELVNYQ